MHGRVWINFKELREKLEFEDVLRLYKVEVKRNGAQHQGPCPLPLHNGPKGPTAFSANLERGIFQCFGCKAKGNLLDFACFMEKANPADGNALRKVAVKLQEALLPKGKKKQSKPADKSVKTAKAETPKLLVNEPLDFELKDLDAEHPYLLDHCCLIPEAIQYFGLGFCSRGLLKGRIAIPLHDAVGRLVGYAGLLVDEAELSEENPRFLFPEKRQRNGVVLDFRRSLLLYNAHRIEKSVEAVIVVEELSAAWWLHQNGFANVVVLMDPDCSDEQMELLGQIVEPSGRIWILSADQQYAATILPCLAQNRFTRWAKLDEDQKATDLTGDELEDRFAI